MRRRELPPQTVELALVSPCERHGCEDVLARLVEDLPLIGQDRHELAIVAHDGDAVILQPCEELGIATLLIEDDDAVVGQPIGGKRLRLVAIVSLGVSMDDEHSTSSWSVKSGL